MLLDAGGLFVAVGAPSNACQAQDRSPGSPGLDPCPELARSAGVWRFDAARPGQTQEQDGHRFVSGVRHVLAIAWQTESKQLYLVQQGRDELSELWPDRFSAEQGDVLPAEEMLLATPGAEFSWPYCYYDPFQNRLVLAPEYGGDGIRVGRCSRFPDPVLAFPAQHFLHLCHTLLDRLMCRPACFLNLLESTFGRLLQLLERRFHGLGCGLFHSPRKLWAFLGLHF